MPAVTRSCLNCPPPPFPPHLFCKFTTLTSAVFKYSVKMLCPNAFLWCIGFRNTLLLLLLNNIHCLPLLSLTGFAEFPILRMRKRRIVAATNTMAKCSWFEKSPVLCVQDTQNVHGGERGRKDKCSCIWSNRACWAIVLFMSYSWVILFISKWK